MNGNCSYSMGSIWCWERLKAGGEWDDRGWDGLMPSQTQWTWVWASSGIGDGQGSLMCCSAWGHKESDITERLNWTTYWVKLMRRVDSLEKTLMLGGIGGRRRRGWQRMIWLDGITDDGRESEWTLGVGDGQGGLACCDSWGCKESDTTERLNWTDSFILKNRGELWLSGHTIFISFLFPKHDKLAHH